MRPEWYDLVVEMLDDILLFNGEHPEITVDGQPAEVRTHSHAAFWTTYCTLVSEGQEVSIKQMSIEAQTLIVRCTYIEESDRDSLVKDVQTYLKKVILFDELSDNDVRCIVTSNELLTTLYFPGCRLVCKDIEATYMPAIARMTAVKYEVSVSSFSCDDEVPLYNPTEEEFEVCYQDVSSTDQDIVSDLDEFSYTEHTKIEQEVIIEADLPPDQDSKFWLPLILSIDYSRSISRSISQVRTAQKRDRPDYTYDVVRLTSKMPAEDTTFDLTSHFTFLQMWKRERVLDPAYYKVIGQAMYTLEHGDVRGLHGWVGVLERASKSAGKVNYFTGQNIRKLCTGIYHSFTEGRVDITSIARYARMDSPDRYREWHDQWVLEGLTGSVSGSDAGLGRAFYRIWWLDFMADTSKDRPTFYKFINHRLQREVSGISLRILISGAFTEYYTAMKANVQHQKVTLVANAASCDMAITMIDKVIDNLGSQRKKREILSNLAERFTIPGISEYIDSDTELTLVKNGVLCVSGPKVTFREGKPQDYLMRSFGASYMQDYSWQHPSVKDLVEWSYITFIDPDTITYFWKFVASLLRGGNTDKKLIFWAGPTANNMKSTWELFLRKLLDQRCINMPVNYYTMGKGAANNHTAAEVRREYARLTFSEEPENNVAFKLSIVKSVCGNDPQSIRAAYAEEQKDIETQDKQVIVCNNPPPISKEAASVERVVVIVFASQCSYDAPKTREDQIAQRLFPRDPLFSRKFAAMVDAALWMQVQIWPLYYREGITVQPETVRNATQAYWDSIDKYILFINECTEKDEEMASIDVVTVYNEFKGWHGIKYRGESMPTKLLIVQELSKRIGEVVGEGWVGIRLSRKIPQPQATADKK